MKVSFKAQCVKTAGTNLCFSEHRTELLLMFMVEKNTTWRKKYKSFFWKCLAQLWLLSAVGAQALVLALGKDLRTCLAPALGCEAEPQLEPLHAKTMCQPPPLLSHHT